LRFPHKTSFDFVHNTRDLRIGIELEARDGVRYFSGLRP